MAAAGRQLGSVDRRNKWRVSVAPEEASAFAVRHCDSSGGALIVSNPGVELAKPLGLD